MEYPQILNENIEQLDAQWFLNLEVQTEPSFTDKAVKIINKKKAFNVKGFRPGKVPRSILEKHVGKESLYVEAMTAQYDKIRDEKRYKTVTDPELVEMSTETDGSIRFKVKVELLPPFEIKEEDYLGIEIEKDEVTDEKKEEVWEKYLLNLEKQFGTKKPVDRPAILGDFATVSMDTTINGNKILELTFSDMPIELDDRHLIDEALNQILGMSSGEQKTAEVSFPADHANPNLAGKTASMTISVNGVKELEYHPRNDELAKKTHLADSLIELKEKRLKEFVEQQDIVIRRMFELNAMQKVIENIGLKIPDTMLNNEIRSMLEFRKKGFVDMGLPAEKAFENLDFSLLKEQATNRLAAAIIFDKLMDTNVLKIEDVSEEQVDKYLQAKADTHGLGFEDVKKAFEENNEIGLLKKEILYDMFVQKIIDNAKPTKKKPDAPTEEPVLSENP